MDDLETTAEHRGRQASAACREVLPLVTTEPDSLTSNLIGPVDSLAPRARFIVTLFALASGYLRRC